MGCLFAGLDARLQKQYYHLVREHAHVLDALTSSLSALPGTRQAFSRTQALWRFCRNAKTTLPTLLEPLREAARDELTTTPNSVALIIHDWSLLSYATHTAKADCFQHGRKKDRGYDLATALLVDAADGQPLGPMELRLRNAHGVISSRPTPTTCYQAHIDEVLDVMSESRRWNLAKALVHVIDREGDSVGHFRSWHAAGHRFVVRVDGDRMVRWNRRELRLDRVAAALTRVAFTDTGRAVVMNTRVGRVHVAETAVTLERPARRRTRGTQVDIPGPPLTLRLVVARVRDGDEVLAEWLLLSNVPTSHLAAELTQWYAWRWRIETFYKLLKSAGQAVESWEQENAEAIAKRLAVASMACLVVWHLMRDETPEGHEVRVLLVRLSGRQMKWGATATTPAVLAGLEKLLAVLDVLTDYTPDQLRDLVRTTLPHLFKPSG
jgi:hypothetical protein